MSQLLTEAERRVLAGLRGRHGEVLRLLASQPRRRPSHQHLAGGPVPVPGVAK